MKTKLLSARFRAHSLKWRLLSLLFLFMLSFNQIIKAQCEPAILSFEALQSPPWSSFCDEIPFRIVIANYCDEPLTDVRVGITIESSM